MKKLITGFIGFCFPSFLSRLVLNLMGHQICAGVRIGFSLLFCDKLVLGKGSMIGHANYVNINTLILKEGASIGSRNRMRGPFDVSIGNHGRISSSNRISRAKFPVTYAHAILQLGTYAIITHNHMIDITCSIYLGDYSIIAGAESQLWTHGYYHADTGLDRIRVDGSIMIGNNVYVGSRCIFNPGVVVGDAIHIGANCCISKSLREKGMYVSQPLRHIKNNIEIIKSKLNPVTSDNLADVVYFKSSKE